MKDSLSGQSFLPVFMMMFDLHTAALIFAVAFAGGLLGLDRTAFGQFMISQPVVVGPLTGWLLGDAGPGIVIGAVLELIWVLDIPVGSFVPADATVGTVSATAIAVIGSAGTPSLDLIGFSIALTTAMVPITMIFENFIRKHNSRLADAATAPSGGDPGGNLARAHLSGLVVFFLKSFVLNLIFITAGLAAVAFFQHLPEKVHTAMGLFVKSLPLLGAALVLNKLSMAMVDRFFIIGFAVAAVLALVLHEHPLVIIALIVATGFWGVRFKEGRS